MRCNKKKWILKKLNTEAKSWQEYKSTQIDDIQPIPFINRWTENLTLTTDKNQHLQKELSINIKRYFKSLTQNYFATIKYVLGSID